MSTALAHAHASHTPGFIECWPLVLANAGIYQIVHNTYYVIAHFYYVLSPGWVFGIFALLVFLYVVIRTLTSGEHAAANYWGEGETTLERTVSSPPPFHTFEELPRVR